MCEVLQSWGAARDDLLGGGHPLDLLLASWREGVGQCGEAVHVQRKEPLKYSCVHVNPARHRAGDGKLSTCSPVEADSFGKQESGYAGLHVGLKAYGTLTGHTKPNASPNRGLCIGRLRFPHTFKGLPAAQGGVIH